MKNNIIYPFSSSWLDYPDNESLAVVLYMTGCPHSCSGCHNPKFQSSQKNNFDVKQEIEKALKKYRTNKIVLSGGDPLSPENMQMTKYILSIDLKIDTCIYTGYELEYVLKNNVTGFKFIKCGKYIEQLKQNSYKDNHCLVLASTNQKLYDQFGDLLTEDGKYYFVDKEHIND